MDRRFEFRVLGPLEVTAEGEPLALGGRQQRALLALLLLSPNEVVSRDRMIDALWGDRPPATATNALQVAVHGLRKILGHDRVVTQGAGYRLEVGRDELDLERFESLVDGARGEPPGVASPKLQAALALFRGVALAGLEGAPFVPASATPRKSASGSRSSGSPHSSAGSTPISRWVERTTSSPSSSASSRSIPIGSGCTAT